MSSARRVRSALDLAATIATLIAAIIVAVGYRRPPEPPIDVAVEDMDGERIEASAITKRQASARVALVEFSDYECPFCARHLREVHPDISREFIDAGTIQRVVFNFPLEAIHPKAFRASEAAECAGAQGRFWEMHERLFIEAVALDEADFGDHASALGIELEPCETCLAHREKAAVVRRDQEEGRRLGVRGTPAFLLTCAFMDTADGNPWDESTCQTGAWEYGDQMTEAYARYWNICYDLAGGAGSLWFSSGSCTDEPTQGGFYCRPQLWFLASPS